MAFLVVCYVLLGCTHAFFSQVQARDAERVHFESVLQSFFFYKEHGLNVVKKHESSFQHLPEPHQQLLCHLPAKFETQKQCIQVIQMFPRYFFRVWLSCIACLKFALLTLACVRRWHACTRHGMFVHPVVYISVSSGMLPYLMACLCMSWHIYVHNDMFVTWYVCLCRHMPGTDVG